MYGHPILVNLVSIILTVPTIVKHFASSAKADVVEFRQDVAMEVRMKKALIKTF